MASLIVGALFLSHKGIVHHRREKQRKKAYARWEDLRDEYDEEKRTSLEQHRGTQSLDLDRAPAALSLRDQQEANDARLSWRPQESWDLGQQRDEEEQRTARRQRRMKTGSTWDEDLPERLRMESRRRSYDDDNLSETGVVDHSGYVGRRPGIATTGSRTPLSSPPSISSASTASTLSYPTPAVTSQGYPQPYYQQPQQQQQDLGEPVPIVWDNFNLNPAPIESHVPGGRMAELIERGW